MIFILSKIPPPVRGIIVGAIVGLSPLQYVFFPNEDEVSGGLEGKNATALAIGQVSFFFGISIRR